MRGDGLRIGSGSLGFCHVCHVLQSALLHFGIIVPMCFIPLFCFMTRGITL